MGCWNKTCGMSQLPIFAGDKVVMFILVESGTRPDNRPCYSNNVWQRISIPFYGEYNDYGWIDLDDGQQHKFDYLKKHYDKRVMVNPDEADRVKTCYGDLSDPFASGEVFGDVIHGKSHGVSSNHPKSVSYGSGRDIRLFADFMVCRTMWDAFTKETTVDYPKKRTYTHADLVQSLTHYREHRAVTASIEDDLSTEEGKLAALMRKYDNMWLSPETYIAERFTEPYNNAEAGVLRWAYSRHYTDGTEISVSELATDGVLTDEDIASVYLFEGAMSTLRKEYCPQTGEGSQSGVEAEHKTFLKAYKDALKHLEHKWD